MNKFIMGLCVLTLTSSAFAQKKWDEKIVTTCEKLDENLKPTGEIIDYQETYKVKQLAEFSHDKNKYYRSVSNGDKTIGLNNLVGVHKMNFIDESTSRGYTTDGTAVPPTFRIESGKHILMGIINKEKKHAPFAKYKAPWNSWFMSKDDLHRAEAKHYEEQEVTVLLKRTGDGLVIEDKYTCFFNAEKSSINWDEWKKVGVDISKVSDGQKDSKKSSVNANDRDGSASKSQEYGSSKTKKPVQKR